VEEGITSRRLAPDVTSCAGVGGVGFVGWFVGVGSSHRDIDRDCVESLEG